MYFIKAYNLLVFFSIREGFKIVKFGVYSFEPLIAVHFSDSVRSINEVGILKIESQPLDHRQQQKVPQQPGGAAHLGGYLPSRYLMMQFPG